MQFNTCLYLYIYLFQRQGGEHAVHAEVPARGEGAAAGPVAGGVRRAGRAVRHAAQSGRPAARQHLQGTAVCCA